MYSQEEINSAVAAGAMSQDTADALRAHVVELRARPVTDEEHFRLINSFNDIFVAIGVVIMLLAVGAIGQAIGDAFGGTGTRGDALESQFAGALVAGTAWMLAEFFTLKRRMALPSILLLLAFVGGVFATLASVAVTMIGDSGQYRIGAVLIALSGVLTAAATYVHWRRFMVPITVAAGALVAAITVIALVFAAVGQSRFESGEGLILSLIFISGLAIFAFAMRWDMSDRTRETRRSDVAFWLHLLAAPMIAHPIFHVLGVTDGGSIGIGGALGVIAVYVLFGLVALAIDRRALLVSALAYVLAALTFLFDEFGAVELNFALTALVIGSALLTLSAFWTPIRQKVVAMLPSDVQGRLPIAAAAA